MTNTTAVVNKHSNNRVGPVMRAGELAMAVAEASNWFMGGSPSISSMVRRRLVVLNWVWTTAPRRT